MLEEGISLPTPLKIKELTSLLSNYADSSFVIRGCREGFDLYFQGPQCSVRCINNTSLTSNFLAGYNKVYEEIAKGRIAGPFSSPPFKYFK